MEIIHDVPKEVIDFIKRVGTAGCKFNYIEEKSTYYYNLPLWFKEENGEVLECDVSELPDVIVPKVFTLDEMKACALAMANWGEGYEGALNPVDYFKETFNIDITQ